MTLRRVVTAVPLRLAAFCAALVVAGCGADPVPSSPVGPAATGPNPPGSVASSAGSAPDLCAIVPRDQLTAIAADLDAGRPGSGSPTGDRSCMFASASDPTTTVELGLRADVADPIGLLEPKALSVDNRRYLPDLGDAAYYDPSAGELKVALDTRVLSIKVRYGPAKTESEATFAALGATAVAALGWTAPTAPSVDPCSLASPAELSGLINDLADGERRRINTEFGAGAACHLRSMSMGHAGSVRISVVDGVDPSAAAATVAKLKPLPEIGPDVYSDAGTVTILDGDRVVTVRVTVGARTGGADAGTTVGRLVAGHLGLAGAATTPADRAPSEPGPAEPGPAEPGPAETTTVESGSANPAPAAGGICTLVPQELLTELAYDLDVGTESDHLVLGKPAPMCVYASASRASRLDVGVAEGIDPAVLRQSYDKDGSRKVGGLGDVAYYYPAFYRLKILSGSTQIQVRMVGKGDGFEFTNKVARAVLLALGR